MVRRIIEGDQFAAVVAGLVSATERSIDILAFDWRWFPFTRGSHISAFNQEIISAVQRGVTVRAVVQQKGLVNDLKKLGIHARKIYARGLMHAKLIIIDEKIVVTGSHNLTQAALTSNHELSVVLDVADSVGIFRSYFNSLYNKGI